MTFGVKLRELRDSAGLTQEELAIKLNLKKEAISQYENGKREPKTAIMRQMCNIFGVTLDELVDGATFNNNPKVVLYGTNNKLVDISMLGPDDQEMIMALAEKFKNKG